jgi:hypothetical protein
VTPDIRRWVLVSAAAIALIGGAVLIVTPGPSHTRPASATTSTLPAPAQQAAPGAGATTPPSTAASVAPAGLDWWHKPATGTYRYHFARTGDYPATYDAPVVVSAAGSTSYSELRDHQSAKMLRSLAVTKDGLDETGFTVESTSGRDQCRWDHPVMILPASAKAGRTWKSTASCPLTVGTTTARVAIESTSRLVGPKEATTPQGKVTLLRIDRVITTRTTTGGKTATRQSSITDYFDTARGLLAQSSEDAAEDTPAGRITYRVTESLLTLQPEGH